MLYRPQPIILPRCAIEMQTLSPIPGSLEDDSLTTPQEGSGILSNYMIRRCKRKTNTESFVVQELQIDPVLSFIVINKRLG